jgi:hypothetical protein
MIIEIKEQAKNREDKGYCVDFLELTRRVVDAFEIIAMLKGYLRPINSLELFHLLFHFRDISAFALLVARAFDVIEVLEDDLLENGVEALVEDFISAEQHQGKQIHPTCRPLQFLT